MKKLSIISLSLLVFFMACHKNSGPVNGNSVQPDNKLDTLVFLSANIDSTTSWQTDSVYAYLESYPNDSGEENIVINASLKTTNPVTTITLNLTNYSGPGTYSITPPSNASSYYVGTNRHYAASGVITITSDSMRFVVIDYQKIAAGIIDTMSDTAYAMIGTFSFITTDSIKITNGKFNVAKP